MEDLQKAVFERILASKDAFYKHQQVGEEELTIAERKDILKDCFENKKPIFIQRYEKYINQEECTMFEAITDPTTVFIIGRIKNRNPEEEMSNIRNRRYTAMQSLLKEGKYFGDEKMREREPYLFDVMVSRFLDEAEQRNLRPSVSREPNLWSGVLEQFEESQEIADRRRVQKAEFEGVRDVDPSKERLSRFFAHINNKDEEEDEMDLDDMKEELEKIEQVSREDAEAFGDEMDGTKEQCRQEFEAFMMERFLAGKDSRFFDYKNVDSNDRLDDNDRIRERDVEERWFDED